MPSMSRRNCDSGTRHAGHCARHCASMFVGAGPAKDMAGCVARIRDDHGDCDPDDRSFPVCLRPTGLTAFKIVAELAISAGFLLALARLKRPHRTIRPS